MKISIIIPTYNEESTIERLMETLEPLNERCEILFVDGGSTDGTLALLKDRYPVIQSPNCDSEVPPTALEEIETVMKKYRAGCFGIAFHSYNFFMFTCRVISNHRIKDRKVMFGDQGIFIDRKLFFEVGKFPEMPILEDYQFSLILKEKGIPLGMTRHRIYTSDRRFGGNTIEKLKVMWLMNRLRAMYRDGVPAEEIAKLYKDVR